MSLAALTNRAPYRVRLGTQAIVEDRHGASAFVVVEPVNDPAERIAFAKAWVEQVNALASCQSPALPQAAE